MSPALNVISTNLQCYGPSETSSLRCLGVSGRAVSISPSSGSEFNFFQVNVISTTRSVSRVSLVCKAGTGGQRRNPDFPRHNRHVFSRNKNRYNEERDSSENLDESEFMSTKNGPILSLSNSPKSNGTASTATGQREREIVELFKKVQAQLRERAAVKEDKKFDSAKVQNKESETVDSLLKLLRKHSAEQGKRKVNGGNTSEYIPDRAKQSGHIDDDKNRSFPSSNNIVREEPQEAQKPSFGRPVSNFRRRSPVPRVKYEPILSAEDSYDSIAQCDRDVKTSETHSEPDREYESDLELELDIASGLDLEHEEEREDEQEEEPGIVLDSEAEFVGETTAGDLSEVEVLDAEEDDQDEKFSEMQDNGLKDLNAMKLVELRALAKARGMKGFSKLKKSELVGLLNDDSMYP